MVKAVKAWQKSLPIVLVGPCCGWILYVVLAAFWDDTKMRIGDQIMLVFLCALNGGIIHLLSYALMGLPLFVFGYSDKGSVIWTNRFTKSIVISVGVICSFLFVFESGGEIYLVVLVYVIWTALCAKRYGPNAANKTQHPTDCTQ